MKYLRKNFSLLLVFFASCFFLTNLYGDLKPKKARGALLLQEVDEGLPQKLFVIVIPSFNNEGVCERNLLSVFDQKYENFRVIYIDDASEDKTFEKVKNFVRYKGEEGRVTLWRNEKNQGALANQYRAIHSCRDEEIVCFLDGDDWLAHDKVLSLINGVYEDSDVWMTHGSYMFWPNCKRGHGQRQVPQMVHKKREYRLYAKKAFLWGPMRTTYAGLLKQVKLTHLLDEGKFYDVGSDVAWMLPLAEMVEDHCKFVKDTLYVYNRDSSTNGDKKNFEKWQAVRNQIASLPSYEPRVQWKPIWPDNKIDVIVHSDNRPLELLATLDSMKEHLIGHRQVKIFYRAVNEEMRKVYVEITRAFPGLHFYDTTREKEEIINYQMETSGANFFLNIPTGRVIEAPLDLCGLADNLCKTRAESLRLEGGEGSASLGDELSALVGKSGRDLSQMALLSVEKSHTPGLFLSLSREKVMPCPYILSPQQQCAYFQEGLKIDIQKLKEENHEVALIPHML